MTPFLDKITRLIIVPNILECIYSPITVDCSKTLGGTGHLIR